MAKNYQMAKSFYFWQTISIRPNGNHVDNCSVEIEITVNFAFGSFSKIKRKSFSVIFSSEEQHKKWL